MPTPREAASSTSIAGERRPSEYVLCVWRSTFGVEESRRSSRLLDSTTPRLHLLPWLHDEPDGGAVLVLDDDVDEGRQTDGFDPGLAQVVARDGDRLDRLVRGARADRLHLGPAVLANDARDRPSNRARPRPGRNLQDITVAVFDQRRAVYRGDRAIDCSAIGVGLNVFVLVLVIVVRRHLG